MKRSRSRLADQLAGGALAAGRVAAHQCGRHTFQLAQHQVGGRRQLVGHRHLRGSQRVAGRVRLAVVPAQRLQAADPDGRAHDPVSQRPAHRVGHHHRQRHPAPPLQLRPQRPRRRVRIDRQQHHLSAPGAFERSIPALAQTNPWCVSAISSDPRRRTIRRLSRSTISARRGSPSGPASSIARADGVTSRRSATRPSDLLTALCDTTTTSPCSSDGAAPSSSPARSAPASISPGTASGRISSLTRRSRPHPAPRAPAAPAPRHRA